MNCVNTVKEVVAFPERLLNADLFLHIHVSMPTADVYSKSRTMNWPLLSPKYIIQLFLPQVFQTLVHITP